VSDPADDLAAAGALMSGITLLAVLLVEIERIGSVVAQLEHDRLMRDRSRANRQAEALAAGRTLRSPGRPKKLAAVNGASPST
jgi:hypothetical protein